MNDDKGATQIIEQYAGKGGKALWEGAKFIKVVVPTVLTAGMLVGGGLWAMTGWVVDKRDEPVYAKIDTVTAQAAAHREEMDDEIHEQGRKIDLLVCLELRRERAEAGMPSDPCYLR